MLAGRYNRKQVHEVLQAAKWIMLLFMLCEAVALILSLLLRFVLEDPVLAAQYDNFDTNNLQVRKPRSGTAAVRSRYCSCHIPSSPVAAPMSAFAKAIVQLYSSCLDSSILDPCVFKVDAACYLPLACSLHENRCFSPAAVMQQIPTGWQCFGSLQDKNLSMQQLRVDVEAGGGYSTTKNSIYKKLRSKMADKYGSFTHGFKWKKSWLGF